MSETTTHRRTRQLKGQLTDLKLRNLETREKPYKVADGNGLFVLVSPSGLRAWRWKYRFAGKEKVLPLGKYPEVTLADARRARDEARNKVLANVDPAEERRDAKFALLAAHENSFETVARAWHKVWSQTKHQRYSDDVLARLERNVFPVIGHKPVSQIEPKDVVRMMDLVQGRGATDIARRLRPLSLAADERHTAAEAPFGESRAECRRCVASSYHNDLWGPHIHMHPLLR